MVTATTLIFHGYILTSLFFQILSISTTSKRTDLGFSHYLKIFSVSAVTMTSHAHTTHEQQNRHKRQKQGEEANGISHP